MMMFGKIVLSVLAMTGITGGGVYAFANSNGHTNASPVIKYDVADVKTVNASKESPSTATEDRTKVLNTTHDVHYSQVVSLPNGEKQYVFHITGIKNVVTEPANEAPPVLTINSAITHAYAPAPAPHRTVSH